MSGLKIIAYIIIAIMCGIGSFAIAAYFPTVGYPEWWQSGLAICALWLGYVALLYFIEEAGPHY
jgi:hypothetical protein